MIEWEAAQGNERSEDDYCTCGNCDDGAPVAEPFKLEFNDATAVIDHAWAAMQHLKAAIEIAKSIEVRGRAAREAILASYRLDPPATEAPVLQLVK